MPCPSAWGHMTAGLSSLSLWAKTNPTFLTFFCQAFRPISENNSWHSSLISSVCNCQSLFCDVSDTVPWKKLTSWTECCATALFSTIPELTTIGASMGKFLERAHSAWLPEAASLTVSQRERSEAISLFHYFFSGQWCHPGRLHLRAWWPPNASILEIRDS